ncbi:MAG: glycosyltransferase family 2 protein [Candidatus Wenzhouxiangella sp. M2_3B_020]
MAVVMKLSVVMNNYNYERFLAQAIDSALHQLGPDDELVVVDDGSTDASHEILDRYEDDSRVRVIRQANQGQLAAMFNGLAAARGDLLLLLDSDDHYLDGYVDRVRELAREHPEVDLFFSAARLGGDGTPQQLAGIGRMLARMELEPGLTGKTRWTTLYTGEYVGTPTSGLALRRGLVDRVLAIRERIDDRLAIGETMCSLLRLPRDSHSIRRLSGDGILVRAAGAVGGQKFYIREPGFHYRIHGGNAYARINGIGRLYLRLARGRQIARLLRDAFEPRRPHVEEVVDEARGRSRPLRGRRRIRVMLNYLFAAVRARGGPSSRIAAVFRIPGAVSAKPTPKS